MQGEDERCIDCPLFTSNLCEEFCDYLSYNFKGVKRTAGQEKMTTKLDFSYVPPLLPFFQQIEKQFADKQKKKKTLSKWLQDLYARHSFLSLNCPSCQEKHEKCSGCPVGIAGQCHAFIQFVSNRFTAEINNDSSGENSNTAEEHGVFMELFRTIENNFTYSGNGSFQGWLNSIYSKKKLKNNYTEIKTAIRKVLGSLEGRSIEILAGDLLLDRKVKYAMVPNKENKQIRASWERDETLVAVSVNKTTLLKYLPLAPSLSLLVYGKANDKAEDYLTTACSAMERNKGIILRWDSRLSAGSVREILEPVFKDNGRMSLEKFLGLTGEIDILTGKDLFAERMIDKLSSSCTLPAERTEDSLLLIDIRREKLLTIVSHMPARNVLVYGSGNYGKMKKQLLATLECASSNMRENNGILLWLKEDLNPEAARTLLQGILRQYIDEEVVPEKENQDGTKSASPLDDEKKDEDGEPDPDIQVTHEIKELKKAIRKCLENELTDLRDKKCATLIYLYLTIYFEILKKSAQHQEAFFENGKVKVEYIYAKMGEQFGIQQSSAKKRYLRCLDKGYSPANYLRKCLAGHL